MNKLIVIVTIFILISCTKESGKDEPVVLEGTGTVWVSGGLYYCATQFTMDTGDTLIPVQITPGLIALRFGDRINLKYSILEERESGCSIGKDCRVIEITKLQ